MEVIERLLTLLGVGAPLALAVTGIVLGLLSKRLGAVTHSPPYYRGFYISAGLACASALFELLYVLSDCTCTEQSGLLYDETFYFLAYSIPLAVGLTLGAVVAWRCWGWLLVEHEE